MYPNNSTTRPFKLEYGATDKAVFNFFNAVYAWMAVGLVVTACTGYAIAHTPALLKVIYAGPFTIVAFMLGAWAIAYGVQRAAARISATAATLLFLLYAAVIGAMISAIFIVYPTSTLIASFVVTGGTFAATSIYGYVTKKDLTTFGSYVTMGIFGLFFASIVNVFWANNALSWLITYGVLFLFIGLTAYETQRLKNIAQNITSSDLAARYAIVGSLMLYISFINMFMSILRIMNSRR
jgi:FtsH-binding integral membrane protein